MGHSSVVLYSIFLFVWLWYSCLCPLPHQWAGSHFPVLINRGPKKGYLFIFFTVCCVADIVAKKKRCSCVLCTIPIGLDKHLLLFVLAPSFVTFLCILPYLVPNSLWFWRWRQHDPRDTLVSTSNDVWHHNPEDHDLKESGVLHCNTHFPNAVFQFCTYYCSRFLCIIITVMV